MTGPMIVVWDGDTQIVRPMTAEEIEAMRPTPTIDDYRAAINDHVETVARGKDYNSAAHMASYVASSVPQWATEARKFIDWRDQVWLDAFQLMQTLDKPLPVQDVIDMLPTLDWEK